APGGGDMMMTGNNGAGNFAGSYAVTLNEMVTLNGSQPFPFGGNATMTFKDGTATDMIEVLTDSTGSCTFTYNRTGDSATASPADQTCSYTLANGSHQTNTNSTHTATISGATVTVNIAGTYVGTTAGGTPYSGTFNGAWTGTRQ